MAIGGWDDEKPELLIDEPEEPEKLIEYRPEEPVIDESIPEVVKPEPRYIVEPEPEYEPIDSLRNESVVGKYEIDGYEGRRNDWHYVTIELVDEELG